MITSSREGQARNEGRLAAGITALIRGDDGPDAVAAGEILAETVLMWRVLLDSKIER